MNKKQYVYKTQLIGVWACCFCVSEEVAQIQSVLGTLKYCMMTGNNLTKWNGPTCGLMPHSHSLLSSFSFSTTVIQIERATDHCFPHLSKKKKGIPELMLDCTSMGVCFSNIIRRQSSLESIFYLKSKWKWKMHTNQ